MGALLCLIADLFVFVDSLQWNLLSHSSFWLQAHLHRCHTLQLWALRDKPADDQSFEIAPTYSHQSGWTGGRKPESVFFYFFLPQRSKPHAFLLFYVAPSRQWDGLHSRSGCRRCLPDRVASPREGRSQQSYLSTALRCVSGQVLLSAIPQVLIYQLSVQTEHRTR